MRNKRKRVLGTIALVCMLWIPMIGAQETLAVYATEEAVEDIFTWEEVTDGICITGLTESGKTMTSIEIPAEIDGKPVVEIGKSAFSQNYVLTEVKLPSSIKKIGRMAFFYCRNLASINLPEGLEVIGQSALACLKVTELSLPSSIKTIEAGAFSMCSNLRSLTLSEENLYYAVENGVIYDKDKTELIYLSYACRSPWGDNYNFTYTMPDSVTRIGDYAMESDVVSSIVFSENLEEIGLSAFAYLSSTFQIHIPAKVSSIQKLAFGNMYNLYDFSVDENNQYYKAVDGCLLSKDGTAFICKVLKLKRMDNAYVTATEVVVPEGVEIIQSYAFYNEYGVTKVTVPEGVKEIERLSFYLCNSLQMVELPASLEKIGAGAFQNCNTNMKFRVHRDSYAETYAVQNNIPYEYYDGDVEPTPTPEPEVEGVDDFVSRLYTVILEREPDETGLAEWAGYLQDGTFTGAEVAKGFIMSNEFLNKDMKNEEFVQIMYQAFFGREADPEGFDGWVDLLDRGYRKSYIFAGFANSTEFGTLCDSYEVEAGSVPVTISEQQPNLSEEEYNIWCFVERMYTEVLNRTPDMQGIQEWVRYLQEGIFTGAEVASGFILSNEFQSTEMTNEEYVKIMYKAFFGREADSEGLAAWVDGLETEFTKEFVFAGFANSGEFGVLCENYGIIQGVVEVPNPTPEPTPRPTLIPSPTPEPTPTPIPTKTPTPTPNPFKEGEGYRIDGNTLILSGTGEIQQTLSTGLTIYVLLLNNSDVTDVVVEEGITGIGDSAFSGCEGVVSIKLPDTLESIGKNAFSYCAALTDIDLPESVKTIGEKAFYNCTSLKSIEIPSGVRNLIYTFENCNSLVDVNIPEGITELVGTFYGCSSLESIKIPEGVTKLVSDIRSGNTILKQGGVFGNCSSLVNVELPTSLTYVGYLSFKNCSALTKIELPKGVTYVGEWAFENCSALTKVALPESLTYVSSLFVNCTSLEKIDLPAGVTDLGAWAFKGCSSLKHFTCPEGLVRVDLRAFEYCTNLISITFTDKFKNVVGFADEDLFIGCDSLTNIYIPAGCYGLEKFFTERGFTVSEPPIDNGDSDEDDGLGDGDDNSSDDEDAEIGTITFDNVWEEKMSDNDFTLSWNSTLTDAQEDDVKYTVIQVYRKYPDGTNEMVLNQQMASLCTEYDMEFVGGLYGVEVSYYDVYYCKVATGQTRFITPDTVTGFRINDVTEGEASNLYGVIDTSASIAEISCIIRDTQTQTVELQQQISLSEDLHKYSLYCSPLDFKVLINNLTAGAKTAELMVTNSDGETVTATVGFTVLKVEETPDEGGSEEEDGETDRLFTDVTGSEWYYEDLCEAVECGILSADGSTAFGPKKDVSIYEYLLWLYRAFGVEVNAYDVLRKADNDGIISATDDFIMDCLNNEVDRKAAAVIAYRFTVNYGVELVFSDTELPTDVSALEDTYITPIRRIIDINVMSADGSGCFSPDDNLSKAEAVTIAIRMMYRNQEATVRDTIADNIRLNGAIEDLDGVDFEGITNYYYDSFSFVRNMEMYLDSTLLTVLDEAAYYLYNADFDMIFNGTATRKEIIKAALIEQYCVSEEQIDEDVEAFFAQVEGTTDWTSELMDSLDFLSDDIASELCDKVVETLTKVQVDTGAALDVVEIAAQFGKSIISNAKVTGKHISELQKLRAVATDEETLEIIDEIIWELEHNFLAATEDVLVVVRDVVIDKAFDILLKVTEKYGSGYVKFFEFCQFVSGMITGGGSQSEAGHKLRALISTCDVAKSDLISRYQAFVATPAVSTLNDFCTAMKFFVTNCEYCINLRTIQNTDRLLIWSDAERAEAYREKEMEKLKAYRDFLDLFGE